MKFYKTEKESKENCYKHAGPIADSNGGFLHFDSDEEFMKWLDETEPMPHQIGKVEDCG